MKNAVILPLDSEWSEECIGNKYYNDIYFILFLRHFIRVDRLFSLFSIVF